MKNEQKLREFNEMLVERNGAVNLTAHRTAEESWQKNILDSLLFAGEFEKLGRAAVLDIGSGGGLPAVPLAVECPDLRITMIDSVNKKVSFLNEVINKLHINNAAAVHARAEDFVASHRGAFDIVTAKAVAELPTLLEYALPLLKVGGRLYAFKGANYNMEIECSAAALKMLCGAVERVESKKLDESITRYLVIIKKVAKTDKKYPRGKNLPRTAPLV
jgi:16S rRNA (guanine527-N7)-methyltransferase